MEMTLLEGLHAALLGAGTLALIALTAVLTRVFKILGPVLEILAIYNRIKGIFGAYSQIPDVVKQKAKEFIKK